MKKQTDKKTINELKKMVGVKGPAWVAVNLGKKDSRCIMTWVAREYVPPHMLLALKDLIKIQKETET